MAGGLLGMEFDADGFAAPFGGDQGLELHVRVGHMQIVYLIQNLGNR